MTANQLKILDSQANLISELSLNGKSEWKMEKSKSHEVERRSRPMSYL
jgi:hypothetical protein